MAACRYFGVRAWQTNIGSTDTILLTAPLSQVYRVVDGWQDLASIGRAVAAESTGHGLILVETTRAFTDMFGRTDASVLPAPGNDLSRRALHDRLARGDLALTRLPGRTLPLVVRITRYLRPPPPDPEWLSAAGLRIRTRYELPNGRRYALLELND